MRLQLIVCALLVTVAVPAARAEEPDDPVAKASIRVYADDDHVTVVTPSAMARTPAGSGTMLAADVTVDAVTAASVDVVTAASPRTVHEERVELGLAATQRLQRTTWLTLGARGSHETDYDALRARVTARRELAQRNTAVELSYVYGADATSSANDASFRETRTSHEAMLTLSQLLSRRTVVDLIADATVADGYHASPYRDVMVAVADAPLAMRVSEATPERRTSIAIAARLRWALASTLFASALYRHYRDDWDIASHTLTTELLHQLSSDLLLGLQLRGYVQDAASFYRARYDTSDGMPTLRTRDRTLGAMRSVHVALTADATIDDDGVWHVVGSAGALRLWFLDFPAQADRDALILYSGVSTSW